MERDDVRLSCLQRRNLGVVLGYDHSQRSKGTGKLKQAESRRAAESGTEPSNRPGRE